MADQRMNPVTPSSAGDDSSRTSSGRVREITTETLVLASKLTVGKTEHLDQYFKRVTHLSLQGTDKKVIRHITNLHHCPTLKVLYLYDNEIEQITNLDKVPILTHLHLQNNRIHTIEQMHTLIHLEKLYLEGNRITRLQGLSSCTNLQELHLSNQTLSPRDIFTFEEETMRALSRSLRVLNLANCHVTTTRSLHELRALQQLDLSYNKITELEDVFALLSQLPGLIELDLRQNAVTEQPKYRERAITFSSARLAMLDKKDIDANQRRMMQSHMAHKFKNRQEAAVPSSNNQSTSSSFFELLPETRRPMKRGSTIHQLRNLQVSSKGPVSSTPEDILGLNIAGSATCPVSTALTSSKTNNNRNLD